MLDYFHCEVLKTSLLHNIKTTHVRDLSRERFVVETLHVFYCL